MTTQVDPILIDSIEMLEWIAKNLARGFLSGKHHSKKVGAGMEFSQYRPYAQGDDLRMLDWKMYGKTGKYYVRMAPVEVDHVFWGHIDDSKSMDYSEQGISKLQIAKTLVAALSYMLAQQGDQFAWESGSAHFPKSSGIRQWRKSLVTLFNIETRSEEYEYAFLGRGIHVWITDLYDEMDRIQSKIDRFLGKGHELVVFHLAGRLEEQLSFDANTKFIDLETNESIRVNAPAYARDYREKYFNHIQSVIRYCEEKRVVYHKVFLDESLVDSLRVFINRFNELP